MGIRPAREFTLRSLDSSTEDLYFYLESHLLPQFNTQEPFRHYHRFGGANSEGENLAVDVDTEEQAWRMMSLSGQVESNQWLATNSRLLKTGNPPTLPQFSNATEALIRRGTFGYKPEHSQHMHIPELDLMIGNLHDFLQRCEYEPFIRVYIVAGMDGKGMQDMADKPWSSHSENRIVMRGASFGHRRLRLDMCVKEEPPMLGDEHRGGMPDELLVPMAIISTLRLRLWETSQRKFDC